MTGPVPLPIILTNSVGTRMEPLGVLIPVKYESSFPSCSTSWTISSVEHYIAKGAYSNEHTTIRTVV